MEWEEAKELIKENILVGTDLNTEASSLRVILEPDHNCTKYDYGGEKGFLVRISNQDRDNLDIPWSMLKTCFEGLKSEEGYNTTFFGQYYSTQQYQHGCHVHVVGMIFTKAGIAKRVSDNEKNYYLT